MDVSVDTSELQLSDLRWAPAAPADCGGSDLLILPDHPIPSHWGKAEGREAWS